ncbi:MAG TPA: acyl-CoA dehydrogenase family protein [Acidimicrobiales bacterium]|nr:acyl-CoA dehydrogenase family protein [Acidimicrobiales bacterium]
MLLELSEDQEFFHQNTSKFLADQMPISEVRRLRHDPVGFERSYWSKGAHLGWTSLLVDEDLGGGSISGHGLVDLCLVAFEFGSRAAAGPLLETNLVASALNAARSHPDVLSTIVSGDSIASWCPPGFRKPQIQVRDSGADLVIEGRVRPVAAADQSSHLLVTGRSEPGLSQVLVPSHAAGVSIKPLQSVDQTRRFWEVTFDDVRVPRSALVGELGGADEDVERQMQIGAVILSAEAVGSMQAAFDLTVEWAFDRYTFGRPLASYQALKHRFAHMKSWLEAAHALSDSAAVAVETRSSEASERASVAKAFFSHYGPELVQDCVQMHGGIGVTYEHDLHLYLRRVTLDASLLGTGADHRRRLADMAERQEAGR